MHVVVVGGQRVGVVLNIIQRHANAVAIYGRRCVVGVGAGVAVDLITAGRKGEEVITIVAGDGVIAGVAIERIVIVAAADAVVASPAMDFVVACATVDRVDAVTRTDDCVVTGAAVDEVGEASRGDRVV